MTVRTKLLGSVFFTGESLPTFYEADADETVLVMTALYTAVSADAADVEIHLVDVLAGDLIVAIVPTVTAGTTYQFPRFVIPPSGIGYVLNGVDGDWFYASGLSVVEFIG